MGNKIFVSYEFKIDPVAKNLPNFFKGDDAPCHAEPIFVRNDVSKEGKEAIKKEIKDVAYDCKGALFLISDNVHNSPWIEHEGQLAIDKGWPVIFVQMGTSTRGVPNVLKNYPRTETASFAPASICAALKRFGL